MRHFQAMTVSTTGKAKTVKFQGRDYFVASAVMMTAGVRSGSAGPIYYSEKFLKREPEAWDHKPIVVYHPQRDGKYVSANDPDILNNSGVGFLLNTKYDHAKRGWRTECWFDKEQTKRVDPRVYNALELGKVTEVSTGMFLKCKREKGEVDGKKYQLAALRARTNDHLAVLPDQKGACSVEDGAGLLVNTVKVDDAKGTKASIYRVHNTLYKQVYSVEGGKVRLIGGPVEVVRNVSYDPVNPGTHKREGEDEMPKKVFNRKRHVRRLIGNGFDASDKAWLLKLKDEELKKIRPQTAKVTATNAGPDDDDDDGDDEPPAPKSKKKEPVANDKKTPEPKATDPIDLIANADPKKLRKALRAAFNLDDDTIREIKLNSQRDRARLVQQIVANGDNIYTEEELKDKSTGELRKLAKFAEVVNQSKARRDDEDLDVGEWGRLYVGNNVVPPGGGDDEGEEDRFLTATPMFTANDGDDDPPPAKKKKKASK